jgi:hypothetical protein
MRCRVLLQPGCVVFTETLMACDAGTDTLTVAEQLPAPVTVTV